MDLFELIWDTSQQRQINEQEERLSSAVVNLTISGERLRALQGRVFQLTAISQVLCDLLVEKLGIPPEELRAAIERRLGEVEADGGTCPSCSHPVHAGRRACLYCGYVLSASGGRLPESRHDPSMDERPGDDSDEILVNASMIQIAQGHLPLGAQRAA